MHRLTAALAFLCLSLGSAGAAEPIVGTWKTPEGGVIAIAACGNAYCATVTNGPHKGKRIGELAGAGASYKGTVTDPKNDRTYQGTAEIAGRQLKLTGCALKVFCRSQTWTRA